MSVNEISDNNNVARYCRSSDISPIDGRIMPTAFHLRIDDSYLSVNWMEFFGKGNFLEAIREIQNIFARKKFGVGASAKFAVLNVGTAKRSVTEQTRNRNRIFAAHEPVDDDPSHAGIFGINQDNYQIIADILAECVEKPTYPARPPAE